MFLGCSMLQRILDGSTARSLQGEERAIDVVRLGCEFEIPEIRVAGLTDE